MRTIGFFIIVMLLWPLFQPGGMMEGRNIPAGKQIIPLHFKIPFNNSSFSPDQHKKQGNIDTNQLKQSDWYTNVTHAIRESEYEIKPAEDNHVFDSPNRQQNLRTTYTADKFILKPGEKDDWKLQLTLKGIYSGKKKIYSPQKDAIAVTEKNKIQFNHNNKFSVEYINSKEGVRQNFIIQKKPADPCSKITVQLSTNKGWYINKVHDRELHFAKLQGHELSKKINYNSLKAWDATNKELAAKFVINKNHSAFEIEVNSADAVYPVTIDPLSTTPAMTLTGSNAGDLFGLSVASAGDINGDGYSDVIVGANAVSSNRGAMYIFTGSSTGLSATPVTTLIGSNPGDHFGNCVASAGDVNGDGFSDVVVGAYGASSFKGAAYLFSGSNTGLIATPTILNGINISDGFGLSVASAGDVNGDGYSDVIVGANGVNSNTGTAYLYLSNGNGPVLSVSLDTTLTGLNSGDNFGYSVACAGDVNGDGYSDIIVGAYGVLTNTGAAYIFLGNSTGLSPFPPTILNGLSPSNYFGNSVASAGDVNGDGYSDVVIGAYGVSGFTGAAYIFRGSNTGLITSLPTLLNGIGLGDYFGISVTCAGDVNGDGYSDVIVGGIYASSSHGAAYLFQGSSTGLSSSPAIILNGISVNDEFGYCVASAGDINGDGYSDVVIDALGVSSNTGAAYTYHGSPDGLKTTSDWQTNSNQGSAYYGISVASAGDVNSDGYSDVIVGAYTYSTGFSQNGKAWLYLGSATGLSTIASWTAVGSMANEYFGYCVASAGDVNGDGYSDVLVGAYGYSNPQTQEGRVYLFYGSSGGLAVSPAWSKESDVAGSVFGYSVAGTGDVNGDGYGDIIIGAPQYNGGQTDEGKVYLFYGTSTVPASAANWSVESNQSGAFFGVSVAGLGDVNGDGFSDIIVGARAYDNGFTDEGQAFAYYGSPTGLPLTPNWTAKGGQANAQFGISVSSAGDVNGDGYCDAIVGAYLYDHPTTDEGAAFVYYGSSTGLSPTANWTAESNIASSFFGYSVSSAGDVNGDGYADVLIGAREISNSEVKEGALYVYYGSSSGLALSSSWYVESNVANSLLGNSVSSAGDVNGDGYSDVIGGAPYYSTPIFLAGAAFVYYGNTSTGLRRNLRLYNSDTTTPIQQTNMADPNLFGAGLYAKSFTGRQKGKLVWQTVRNGNPFSGPLITNSTAFTAQQPSLTDLGRTGIELKDRIAKMVPTKATYVRARVKYDLTTAITGQVYGPWRYPEGFMRGRRDIGSVALPVKFISFTAAKQNETVLLKWITTNETAGMNYEVQHSTDGIAFTTIKTIPAQNNSRNEYEWLHTDPSNGKNFYRIRAVENGNDAFTATRQVVFQLKGSIKLYPNPVKSGAVLTIESAGNLLPGITMVEILDMSGQKKKQYLLSSPGPTVVISLPELPAGSYILNLINGKNVLYSDRFLVL